MISNIKFSKILVGQINLQKSRPATLELRQVAENLRLDMVLVQKPYAYIDPAGKWRIPGFSTYKIAACSRERPLAAIIILNQKPDALRLRTDSEQHFTAIKFQTARRKELLVGSIYCNPTSEIIPLLEAIGNMASKHVLAPMIFEGDFNAKSNLWHSRIENDRGLEVERFLAEEDMFVLNRLNEPDTFSTVNGTANIDLTIVDSRAHRAPHTWKVLEDQVASDHRLIIIEIGWDLTAVEPDLGPTKYNVRRVNLEKLNQLSPGVELRLRNQRLTNESELKHEIQKLTNEMVQVTGSVCKAIKHRERFCPWWSEELSGLKALTKQARKAYQCAISRNLSQEIKDQRKQAYQNTLRDYKTFIRRAKSESWGEFVETHLGTNPWRFTYKLASAKVRTSHLTSVIEDSVGQETTDMAETLQEIACQLMPDDDPVTDNEENRRIRNGVREFTGSNIPVSPITEEDITEAAMRVKPGRAPGPDEVHGKILVMMLPYIMESLLRIYNACLSMGIIPTVWKEGRLVTILKAPGRDPSDMGSSRPITLLSELGKMLERIIISKIQKAIPANRLISDNQFGFLKEKSTVDAIKHMIGHIDTQDKHHLVVYIGIKGAFNNMWWPTLLKFLHEVDIPAELVALLNNYLKDRKIRYQSNLEQIEKILTKRCPQGSALGPFLWNLTMELLLRARWPNKVAITAYADDIALAINADSRRQLEELVSQALEIVSHWAESHKLDISVNKTKYIVFSKLSINRNPIVRYRDVPIDRVRHLKYLGVDERMSFTEHIGYISNKARSIFQSLRKFALPRWGNCVDSLKKIYQVAIIPIVEYASEV
ncbi:hypothetical protein JTB14_011335 [Gonioctena quinquepunctata]|nr:hypothetical protein JTB14_011335 [Gonioctena quinquepunctata]